MKTSLLSLAFIFLGFSSFSQVLLDDTFKDNSNNWPVGKDAISKIEMKTKIDQYHLKHLRKVRILSAMIPVKIDEKRDYKIEALLYKKGGTTHSGYGLMWGASDANNFYSLLVTGDGAWLYGKCEEGSWRDITDNWQDHNAIQDGRKAFNKFTVLKQGNMYTFKINDAPVAKVPVEPFYGNMLGFNVNRKQRIMVEWIKVEYL